MEDDWEALADSAEPIPVVPKPNLNKWDGEDEEEEVKESWEDEGEEEKKDEEKSDAKPKPKKTLQQKIAEKEKQKQEQLERKLREAEEENMTPEEKLAEKLRLQKIAEENDLKLGLESLGLSSTKIDGRNPSTAEEFTELADAIGKKIAQFRHSEEFGNFAEEIVRNICASLPSNSIRKIKTTVDNLYLEKQKMEKGDKPKKGKGSKVKARLRMEGDNTKLDDYVQQYTNDYDEYDDFM